MWEMFQQPSCAKQVNQRNYIEEMSDNTNYTSSMMKQIIIENRKSQRINNIQFVVTTIIMIATLYFSIK